MCFQGEPFHVSYVTSCQCLFSVVSCYLPLFANLTFAVDEWKEVAQLSAEENLCWRQFYALNGCIPILQQGTCKLVCVQRAMWAHIVSDKPLSSFYSQFCSTVGMWEGNRTDPVTDTPVFEESLCKFCHEGRSPVR